MNKIEVGDIAPDFSLTDQDGKNVHLADFRGKNSVVLIFYPADQTPGCTKQLCAARDDTTLYEQAGAKVFGVNPGSGASHVKFIQKHGLKTPLLVDKGLEVASRYDAVMGFGLIRVINRTVVGIDQAGKIIYYKRGMPGTGEILAALKSVPV